MLYKLIFIGGTATFIATLADVLLSDKQKERLSDLTINIWNWVDEARSVSMYERFLSPRVQNIIITTALVIISIIYILVIAARTREDLIKEPSNYHHDLGLIIGSILGGLFILWLIRIIMKKLLPKVLRYLAKSKNIWTYIAKLTILNITLFAMFAGAGLLISGGHGWAIAVLILLLPLVIVWPSLLLVSIFLYVVAVLIILAYLILYPLEFVLRRIAEYPAGPVLALSGLVAAIGGFAEVLTE